MTGYALLLASGRLPDRQVAARLIAARTGRTVLDALQAIHHGNGLLAEGLGADQVQELGAALRAVGVETFAVPAEAWLPLPRPLRILRATPTADQLILEDGLQRTLAEPWSAWRLLCAGTLPAETGPDPAAAALAALAEPGAGPAGDDEAPARQRHLADLFFGDQAERAYRFESASFSYPYLAAAGRLSLRHEANWFALLEDLVTAAPEEVWISGPAQALAAGRVVPPEGVGELRLYEAEVRWRLQRWRVLGAGDD